MQKIIIDDLKIYGHHGCLAEEKKLGQFFFVSLELRMRPDGAGATLEKDHISATVNYGEVSSKTEYIVKNTRYDLIESLGEEIAQTMLLIYPELDSVLIKVKKPSAPVPTPFSMISVEIERSWHTAYLGMGSNLEDREKNIVNAIDLISVEPGCKVLDSSKIIETKPWGKSDQPDFLNNALAIKTFLCPIELLHMIKSIERQMGRKYDMKWGPRIIDIDILLYDMVVMKTEELQVPHPYMHERVFVLEPLNEIAPTAVHPVKGKYIRELLADSEGVDSVGTL